MSGNPGKSPMVLKVAGQKVIVLLKVDNSVFLRVYAGLGLFIGTSCSGLDGNIPLFPENNHRTRRRNSGVRAISPKRVRIPRYSLLRR